MRRFERPPDPDEAAEQLEDQLRDARQRVFRSYVRTRERGVDLLDAPAVPGEDEAREQDDGGVAA